MINKQTIELEQVYNAVKDGEFAGNITASAPNVVIIMTQDWCPQWMDMKSWIYSIETDKAINIYEIVYNKEEYFEEFRNFKENSYKNDIIPYLRYYKDGSLVYQSNYVGKEKFKEILQI